MHRTATRPLVRLLGVGVIAAGALALLPAAGASAAPATPPAVHHHRQAACRHLVVTLGPAQGAAGTTLRTIRFRNVGTTTCRLRGFPRVVYTDAAHHRVGKRAGHAAGTVRTVRLAPGRMAAATLGVPDFANFPVRRCKPADVTGLRVTVAGHRYQVAFSQRVCTTRAGRAHVTPYRHHR